MKSVLLVSSFLIALNSFAVEPADYPYVVSSCSVDQSKIDRAPQSTQLIAKNLTEVLVFNPLSVSDLTGDWNKKERIVVSFKRQSDKSDAFIVGKKDHAIEYSMQFGAVTAYKNIANIIYEKDASERLYAEEGFPLSFILATGGSLPFQSRFMINADGVMTFSISKKQIVKRLLKNKKYSANFSLRMVSGSQASIHTESIPLICSNLPNGRNLNIYNMLHRHLAE